MERKLKKFFLRKFSQISSGRWKDRLFFNPRSDYHLLMIDYPGDYKRENAITLADRGGTPAGYHWSFSSGLSS